MTKPTILCVDDERDNVEALERLFRKKYQVLKATSGAEALQLLDQTKEEVALILTDQRMPEMTGVEFLEKTLAQHPDTLRLLLTGYTDIESVIMAVNKGQIYRYLTKPWDPVDLAHTVDQAVERYFLGRELKEKNRQLTQALEELKSLDTAKSNFMILINHELKTPLTSVLNFSALLKETSLQEEQKSYLNRIDSSAQKLRHLIEDVLLIMKAETRQLKIEHQSLIVSSAQGWITEDTKKLMSQKNLTLEENLKVEEVVADPRLMGQIFQRLLHNAAKFGHFNSPIKVSSEISGNEMVFSIRNWGPSIPSSTIEKVFKPFYIDENIMNHSSGVGLGLSICESILKAHSSHLRIQNHEDGVEVLFSLQKK